MNYVDVELDAYEIADQIFKDNSDFNKNVSFENVNTRTFFEMLLIITVEGLKKFYGDENNKVNITNLTKDDVDKINKYLQKINVKLNFKIYDFITYTSLMDKQELKNFKDMIITNNTNLKEINYIIKKSTPNLNIVYAISYDYVM